MKNLLTLAVSFSVVFASSTFADTIHERVRGTVSSITATALVVHTATGDQTVTLTPQTNFLQVEKSGLSSIAPGSYIGTATKTQGPEQVALEVVIFPPAMKGTGDGHYPWDEIKDTTLHGNLTTHSSMTNGSVATVQPAPMVHSSMTNGNVTSATSQGGSQKLTVTYKGGQQTILVPATAPIVTFVLGQVSDVKPGATVFVNGTMDGSTVTAGAVAVGVGGATPPM